LTTSQGLAYVVDKITLVQNDAEAQKSKSAFWRDAADFGNRFCKFVVRFSDVVEVLLPPSPEYTVTYGLLLLLFKVSKDRFS